MHTKTLLIIAAVAALAAGCHRNESQPRNQPQAAPKTEAAPSTGASQMNGTGVQSSAAAASSGKTTGEGENPHQQHADPKEPAQHRDFEQKGDGAGPKNPQSPQGK